MTKAKQKALAIDRIENRIKNMQNVDNLETLEMYDFVIETQIHLLFQLEIITEQERYTLENKQIDVYIAKRDEVKSKYIA